MPLAFDRVYSHHFGPGDPFGRQANLAGVRWRVTLRRSAAPMAGREVKKGQAPKQHRRRRRRWQRRVRPRADALSASLTRTSRVIRVLPGISGLALHAYFVAEPTCFAFWKLSIAAR